MEFDYSVYFNQNCLFPLIFLIISILSALRSGAFLLPKIGKTSFSSLLKNNLTQFIGLAVSLLLIIQVLPYLTRGGFYLLFEKETDAVELVGVIEDTDEIGNFGPCKYDVEENNGKGEIIVIDNQKYHIMTYKGYSKGDTVRLKVLPKSRFVLEITGTQEKSNTKE